MTQQLFLHIMNFNLTENAAVKVKKELSHKAFSFSMLGYLL